MCQAHRIGLKLGCQSDTTVLGVIEVVSLHIFTRANHSTYLRGAFEELDRSAVIVIVDCDGMLSSSGSRPNQSLGND